MRKLVSRLLLIVAAVVALTPLQAPVPAAAAVAAVQYCSAQGGGTSQASGTGTVTVTCSTPPVTGHVLVAFVAAQSGSGITASPGTWTTLNGDQTQTCCLIVALVHVVGTGEGSAYTFTNTNFVQVSGAIAELSGASINIGDYTNSANNAVASGGGFPSPTTAVAWSPSFTPVANSFLLAAVSVYNFVSGNTVNAGQAITVPSGTTLGTSTGLGVRRGISLFDEAIGGTPTSLSLTGTLTDADTYENMIQVVVAATATPTATPTPTSTPTPTAAPTSTPTASPTPTPTPSPTPTASPTAQPTGSGLCIYYITQVPLANKGEAYTYRVPGFSMNAVAIPCASVHVGPTPVPTGT